MGLWDNVKNFMSIETDEFGEEEATFEKEAEQAYGKAAEKRREPRIFQNERRQKGGSSDAAQMQVVIVKPDHFEDVTMIADHLNAKKSVVLNLEAANRETSRRIIDFISGVAYANHDSIKKVANCTFMIAPNDVDVMGELMTDEYEQY